MKRKTAHNASANEHMENGLKLLDSPPHKKLKPQQSSFSDDAESSSSSGGQSSVSNSENELIVNEAYAKRFEHNKKREERQRCMYERYPESLQHSKSW